MDLIGFVIPGHSIDHDVDPEANRHLTLLFAAGHDRGERISALIAGPGRRPIISSHYDGRHAIAAAGYDLSINRYKEVVHETAEHRPPREIIAELKALENGIADGLAELERLL